MEAGNFVFNSDMFSPFLSATNHASTTVGSSPPQNPLTMSLLNQMRVSENQQQLGGSMSGSPSSNSLGSSSTNGSGSSSNNTTNTTATTTGSSNSSNSSSPLYNPQILEQQIKLSQLQQLQQLQNQIFQQQVNLLSF